MSTSEKTAAKSSNQGIMCVWNGLGIPLWLKLLFIERPPIHWTRLPRLLSISATSISNSCYHVIEKALWHRRLQRVQIEHPPVFILGHWRSGTTLLHNLLARDPQFTYPNLYQCLFPGHFLLTERVLSKLTAPFLPKTRPMDNMPCAWDLPQEDEAALLLMTLKSPYLMTALHSDRSRYEKYYDLTRVTPAERQQWKDAMLLFMKKLTLRCNKPIVLKSPTHTFRIPLLLELFPDAKFIYIYRNPYTVFNSTLHLRQVMCRFNGLSRPNFGAMDEMVFQGFEEMFAAYERDRTLVRDTHLHEVRFEDFEADPISQLRAIYEKFGFDNFEAQEAKLQAEMGEHRQYRKNRYELNDDLKRRIYERWKPAFERYGYPSQLPQSPSPVRS